MRLPLALGLALLLSQLSAAEPVIWRLEEPARIGGQATEVLGAPRVATGADAPGLWFNGASDGLFVPANPLAGLKAFTIEVCLRPDSTGPEEQRFLHVQDTPGATGNAASRVLMELRLIEGTWALDTFLYSTVTKARLPLLDRTKRHPADRWTWVALVYDGRHMTHFIDGVKELEGDVDFPPLGPGLVSLGVRQNKVSWFKGGLREVRWHARALSPEQLQQMK